MYSGRGLELSIKTRPMKQKHPKGLYILFFSEMWERFSFYGMRSLLVLYMTKLLLFSDTAAYGVYGAYGALVYACPVIGGMVADRLLGYRKAIILGGVLMALGHFCMAVPGEKFLYIALALLCVGNGFFKPNISSIVGKLYPEGDPRRDAGFTIFYMGINLGAFFSPLVCGLIGEKFGWHYGFGIAGVGMLAGLAVFLKGKKYLEGHGEPPAPEKLTTPIFAGLKRQHLLYVACALAVPLLALALNQNQYVGNVLYIVGAAIVSYLLYVAFTSEKVARDRLLAMLVLLFFNMLFWAFFEQAGSSLMLFADRNVDRMLLGWETPASLTQSINPLFIILLAPLFARAWVNLSGVGKQPSIPIKFMLGIVQVGLGFGALVIGGFFAKDGVVPYIWLVLAYLLHTTGELCISPVGLSAVTKLSPVHVVGTVMGTYFLSTSFAQYLAGFISKLTAVTGEVGLAETITAAESLPVYSNVFYNIGLISIAAAGVLFLLSFLLKRMMHGIE